MPSTIIDSTIFQGIFGTDAMRRVWSDENRTEKYVDIERALAIVQARLGIIPQEAADEIVANCRIEKIDLTDVRSAGYCFQADLAWRTLQAGLRVREVPIEFVERVRGESKMTREVATESLRRITAWGVRERVRRLRDVFSKATLVEGRKPR